MQKLATVCFFMCMTIFVTTCEVNGENPSPCRIAYPSDDAVPWQEHTLKKRESLETLFADRWQDVARFNRIDRLHAQPGICLKIPLNLEDIEGFSPMPKELAYPEMAESRKYILIDLSEQFLGAYEEGALIFSFPITSGRSDFITPPGDFQITAFSRNHASSLYRMEDKDVPYPMHYALRFLTADDGIEYWIHGRDLPGYPASHGCVGLYDEEMQHEYYGNPEYPLANDAQKLFQWAIAPRNDDGEIHGLKNGPNVLIIGEPPGGFCTFSNPAPGP